MLELEKLVTHTDRIIARARRPGVIRLQWGEPAFPPPRAVREALLEALDLGLTRYTPPAGLPELREAIARKLREKNSVMCDAREVVVTAGGTAALHFVFRLLARGGAVAVQDPGWFAYPAIIRVAGAEVVWVPEEKLGYEELERAREDAKRKGLDLRVVVVNTPSNPSGTMFSRETLKEVLDFAEDRGVWVVSDEVYEDFVLDGTHVSPASISRERVFAVYSLSKTYALTGLRIGYVVAPDESWARRLTIMQLHTYVCPTSFAQHVARVLIERRVEREYMSEWLSTIRKNVELTERALRERGIEWRRPKGGIYAWFPLPGQDSAEFARLLLEKMSVAVAVGKDFGTRWDEWIRVTTAVPSDTYEEGLRRIFKLYDELSRR